MVSDEYTVCDLIVAGLKEHAWGITKKRQEGSAKGHNCGFLPLVFPNLGDFERYTPTPPTPQFLVENKTFYSSKMALLASTTRNNWLKQAMCGVHFNATSC